MGSNESKSPPASPQRHRNHLSTASKPINSFTRSRSLPQSPKRSSYREKREIGVKEAEPSLQRIKYACLYCLKSFDSKELAKVHMQTCPTRTVNLRSILKRPYSLHKSVRGRVHFDCQMNKRMKRRRVTKKPQMKSVGTQTPLESLVAIQNDVLLPMKRQRGLSKTTVEQAEPKFQAESPMEEVLPEVRIDQESLDAASEEELPEKSKKEEALNAPTRVEPPNSQAAKEQPIKQMPEQGMTISTKQVEEYLKLAIEMQKPCRMRKEETKKELEVQPSNSTVSDGRTCKFCYRILGNKFSRTRHELKVHTNEKNAEYICDYCQLRFDTSMKLRRHQIDCPVGEKRVQPSQSTTKKPPATSKPSLPSATSCKVGHDSRLHGACTSEATADSKPRSLVAGPRSSNRGRGSLQASQCVSKTRQISMGKELMDMDAAVSLPLNVNSLLLTED